MTASDAALERELLELFAVQAALLLSQMQGREHRILSALAHTLKGAALGIGACHVAEAAATLERAGPDPKAALMRLAEAIGEARIAIAGLLAPAPE